MPPVLTLAAPAIAAPALAAPSMPPFSEKLLQLLHLLRYLF
jgi:predicted secreted protein